MPAAMSLASIGLFDSTASSFSHLSWGSRGAAPSQVDGVALHNSSCGGQPGLCFALVWAPFAMSFHIHTCPLVAASWVFACGGASSSCLPCYNSLHLLQCLPSFGLPFSGVSTMYLALPFAQGTNASDLAVVALSASPAGSTLAVPSPRAGATPPLVHACQHPSIPSCPHLRL